MSQMATLPDMKTTKNVRVAILALALFASGCRNAQEKASNNNVVEIDGCEYITVENSVRVGNNYNFAITHKGNCKNPIHHWNGGKHD
jgi:PBP1b-binding outer membrane lipoprotein LpoB